MQLLRQALEARVVLLELGQLGPPLGLVDAQQLGDMFSSVTSRPRVSMPSSPTGGSRPIGVSRAAPRPAQRANTHASTREFSPKPGHRKRPSSSLRNQLT